MAAEGEREKGLCGPAKERERETVCGEREGVADFRGERERGRESVERERDEGEREGDRER